MDVVIIRTGPIDIDALVAHLQQSLPPDIGRDARIVDTGVTEDDDPKTPCIPVIAGTVETIDQADAVRHAVAAFGNGALRVETSEDAPPQQPGEGGTVCLPNEPPASLLTEVDDISSVLKWVIETTASDTPGFPEESYAGKEKIAYDHIVKKLHGRVPRTDCGATLFPSEITSLKRPGGIDARTWDEVTKHLANEVTYFKSVIKWFGDNGHLRVMLGDQTLFSYMFLDTLNDTYLKLPSHKTVSLAIDVMMGLAVRAISAADTEGKVIAAALDAIWKVAKGTQPDYKSTITAEISAMKVELAEQFSLQINTVEQANGRLFKDWGLLKAFGSLVYYRKLTWPTNLKPARTAASVAFHTHALSRTVKLMEPMPYVCCTSVEAKASHKRFWNPDSGDCHLRSSRSKKKTCGSYWFREFYLAWGSGGAWPDELPRNLQSKIFGTHRNSDWDPQLAMPPHFYTRPHCNVRNGWGLKQIIRKPPY